jgi:hypothetical protein
MGMGNLLYIYDDTTWALSGGPHDGGTVRLPVSGGRAGLKEQLNHAVASGKTFDRVLWQAHGAPGEIKMAGYPMKAAAWLDFSFDYGSLFPSFTKMLFDGCNVGEGEDGWKFLEAAGTALLKRGGWVMGWTSSGLNYPGMPKLGSPKSWAPMMFPPVLIPSIWFAGHGLHPWGELKMVLVLPGAATYRFKATGD